MKRTKGLRKICEHSPGKWPKCPDPWHFNFKWKGTHYRFSLDKHLGRHVDSKDEAEVEAAKLRIAIKAGTFGQPVAREDMTVRQLADVYLQRYVAVKRAFTAQAFTYALNTICRTMIPLPTGGEMAFGDWRLADVITDTIERFREKRLTQTGIVGVNRNLGSLRSLFGWAVRRGYVERTPFKLGTEVVIELEEEHGRSRRLEDGEEAQLFAACTPHLRAIIECALETGMRKGEIMSLQFSQIRGLTIDGSNVTWAPNAQIVLPWAKTKTRKDREIPISTRLRSILEMRRYDPNGEAHALDKYVFGTEIGTRILNFGRAWSTAVLKSHGYEPAYTKTANLTLESRLALKKIDLHFHDLRRECGSRWLDLGVPLHTVRDWLGHTNVTQTSTYLANTQRSQHNAMQQYEERKAALQRACNTVGTGGHNQPQSATGADEKPSKTTVGHGSTIM